MEVRPGARKHFQITENQWVKLYIVQNLEQFDWRFGNILFKIAKGNSQWNLACYILAYCTRHAWKRQNELSSQVFGLKLTEGRKSNLVTRSEPMRFAHRIKSWFWFDSANGLKFDNSFITFLRKETNRCDYWPVGTSFFVYTISARRHQLQWRI